MCLAPLMEVVKRSIGQSAKVLREKFVWHLFRQTLDTEVVKRSIGQSVKVLREKFVRHPFGVLSGDV